MDHFAKPEDQEYEKKTLQQLTSPTATSIPLFP